MMNWRIRVLPNCRCKNVIVITDTFNAADAKTVLLIQLKYLVLLSQK
jgi:hypothetical protein